MSIERARAWGSSRARCAVRATCVGARRARTTWCLAGGEARSRDCWRPLASAGTDQTTGSPSAFTHITSSTRSPPTTKRPPGQGQPDFSDVGAVARVGVTFACLKRSPRAERRNRAQLATERVSRLAFASSFPPPASSVWLPTSCNRGNADAHTPARRRKIVGSGITRVQEVRTPC